MEFGNGLLIIAPFLALGVGLASVGAESFAGLVILPCIACWVVLLNCPTQVLVGNDGISVAWLRRERFVPFASVVDVVWRRAGWVPDSHVLVTIELDSGRFVRVAMDDVDQAEALVRSIRVRAARATRSEVPTIEAAQLHHIAHRLSTQPHAPYRTLPVDICDLWTLLEHPAANPDARADAAAILAPQVGREGTRRLARVARTTANPKLRELFRTLTMLPRAA